MKELPYEEEVPGYTSSDVLEFDIYLDNDFFDLLIQDTEEAIRVDSLVEAIRIRETERIQRILDIMLGKGKALVLEGE